MNKKSFTLLNQREIDTLVDFLNDKKEGIHNEVLSQSSIDKLISIIRGSRRNKFRLDNSQVEMLFGEELLISLDFCKAGQVCELKAELDEETAYLKLTAVNRETGEKAFITPDGFLKHTLAETEEGSSWGFSISPDAFNEIAEVFGLKYTRESYDFICEVFSEKNYGRKGIQLGEVFLPDAEQLVDNIME